MNVIIDDMTEGDPEKVARLEKENFTSPWTVNDFSNILSSGDSGCVVARLGDEIVGCVVYRNILGDVDITNVSVDKRYRRCGIAHKLMRAALEKGKSIGGERFTLEVRATNVAAIKLYESFGFIVEGIRRNFYKYPTEDGLIMWLR
ncbi:MAG: ribosomal protein S18-alanine N-acetyltransferase [Lachnospiraceae bacterium]|nr:ribosomal protein S18-alanine N-acetyltransferase [Lachnospiraceae bacterium]